MTRKPPTKRLVPLASAARLTEGAAGGVFISDEIVNALSYNVLIIRTMPNTEVGTATLDIKVQGYDETSAAWYDIAGASLSQISANRTTAIDLVIGLGLTAVANRVVSQPVPYRARVHTTVAGAASGFTYGIEAELQSM